MPLYLYQRPTGIFYIRGSAGDQSFDRSLKTRRRNEAEQIKAKLESDAFKAAVYGERSVARFEDAVVAYLRAGGDGTHMTPLIHALGSKRLSEVTQAALDALAAERTVKPSTLVRQLYTPVAAVMNFAASDAGGKLCDPVRFRKPKIRNARVDYLTPAEAEALIAVLPAHLQRLVVFYLSTGCRASEALDLTWRDVSPAGERVTFWETKGGYARSAALGKRAREALPDREEGLVFLNSRGEPWHAYDAVNLMLKRYAERHGLRSIHLHLFRHTWATWAYAATRDLTFLMAQGGWRSPTMVMRYTHAASDDLALAALAHGWEFDGKEIIRGRSKRAKPQ